MSMDPRTPVLVVGGQITMRDGAPEPVDMIVAAAREGARQAGGGRILESVDSIRLVGMLSWRYRDPGRLVGERLGAPVRHTSYTGDGGNAPQALVNNACADIVAGRSDTVLIGGAEAWRTRMKLRAVGERPAWTDQGDLPKAEVEVPEVPMVFDGQKRVGLDRPAFMYPLFEQALRLSAGWAPDEHRRRIAELWSRFSRVATENPHAWVRDWCSPERIATATPDNRMIAWPYTKLMNSNNMVDQAAAVVLTSAETADRLGVPRDHWVFPQAGADAHDTFDVAERGRLDESPAIRIAAQQALAAGEATIDEVDHLDIYSCFPSAVQVGAAALGLDWQTETRPLTVTGGLTFAGGPWNNYSTHAIAAMADVVRAQPGTTGLVTANGGYLTKHSIGVYRTEPPRGGFRRIDAQPLVDRLPRTTAVQDYVGPATVESWTVEHDREGSPSRAFLAVRTADGARAFAGASDPDLLSRLVGDGDVAGLAGAVTADGDFAPASGI